MVRGKMKKILIYILVCLGCGEEFKYKQGEIGKCPYCGCQLAVDTREVIVES